MKPATALPLNLHLKRAALALALVGTALLASCATAPLPQQWVRLPAKGSLPAAPTLPALPTSASAGAQVWQLMGAVTLPGHLDRDALLVPRGSAGLQPLPGARWAEPLRDAVPRLLRSDLAGALGSPVWQAPLPPGVRPTHQLRVELLALDVAADGASVLLQARWSVASADGASPPRIDEAAFRMAATGNDAAALATAHRDAVQALALRIAAAARLR